MLHYFSFLWSFHFLNFHSIYCPSHACCFYDSLFHIVSYVKCLNLSYSFLQCRIGLIYICWRNETFMVKPRYSNSPDSPSLSIAPICLDITCCESVTQYFFLTAHICQTWLKYWEQKRKHNRPGLTELKLFPVWKQR